MSAVLRDTTLYTSKYTNKYLQKAYDDGGRVVPIAWELTVASAMTTGDTYNICVLPANARVIDLTVASEAMSASGGVNVTLSIGDSGSSTRYLAATDVDLVNSTGHLAFAGMHYVPTADTIVVALLTGVFVVGKKIRGVFLVVPAA